MVNCPLILFKQTHRPIVGLYAYQPTVRMTISTHLTERLTYLPLSAGLSLCGACRIQGAGPGEKIDKQIKTNKTKKGLQQTKEKNPPLRHRERGALESAEPVAYATFATRLIRHCYRYI